MKNIRKAVRTFLIKDNEVVAIKYITKNNMDFYDVPGGKIEENETSIEAAIREFKEETGMDVYNLKYIGNLIAEYPNKIFDFDIYVTNESESFPKQTEENESCWIDINKLKNEHKIFPAIQLLNDIIEKDINNFKLHYVFDENHNKQS